MRLSSGQEEAPDLNRLHTQLNRAIEEENFEQAAQCRDLIRKAAGEEGELDSKHGGGWIHLGAPEWLADRAERLGFRMPTRVQRNAMNAAQLQQDVVIR